MKLLTILGIGFGVGMLGGLLIVWFDLKHRTPAVPEASAPKTIADGRR